ncbi:hypothetical protein EW026_g1088 [Hermanssonia centrifuga]|uniref:Uncharacterized protein n=1 Tax=Hermanssonia centrifuga TaxID=98765 RepID=A0A4V6S120_9APHY|nr:hypothetical protein EW026_g1088 [Hermanssonia centrifuga]
MSPRKRQKTEQSDLDARWCEARDLLLEAYEEDNDGLPLLVSHYKSKDRPAGVRPRAVGVVIQGGSVSEPEETQAPWEPPGPNELYDLPGELVLAKEKPRSSEYWPAKLIEYIPPQKPTQKPKYKALFFDGIIKDIPKDMFYSIYDTEFKSCKMGAAADDYDLNENAEDEGADDFTMTFDDNVDEESLRAPSPDPKEPAPIAFAHDLTIPEQFEYSKPVLVALMNGEYPPATHLHVAFMKGGRWRNQVTSSAWKRGELSHKEKEELSDCIRRWMHKRMVRQKLGLVPPDTAVRMQDGDHVSPDEKQQDTSAVGQVVLEKDDSVEPPPCTQSSAGDTEYAHSVAAGPPSSFIVSDILEETDGEVEILDSVDSVDKNVTKVVVTQPAANAAPVQMAVTNIPEHPPELSDTDQEPLLSRSLPTYAMLSGIDQITYCTSVLLPEAILQLLLWRNNLRRSPQLLSREEEEELHRQAEERASASYWVHDIVYMKRSAEGKTLPPYVSEPPDQATSSRGRRQLRRH